MVDVSKLSLGELRALRNRLAKRETKLQKGQVSVVRKKVVAMLRKEGLTMADLTGGSTPKAASAAPKKTRTKSKLAGKKVEPKFRNPNNPKETWTGRGINPKWFAGLIASGMTREQLEIK